MAKKLFTIDGISVKIDERVFSDYRLGEMNVRLSEQVPEEGTDEYQEFMEERGKISIDMIDFVLGSQKNKVIDQIAAKNDGFATAEDVFNWLAKLLEKNADVKK